MYLMSDLPDFIHLFPYYQVFLSPTSEEEEAGQGQEEAGPGQEEAGQG